MIIAVSYNFFIKAPLVGHGGFPFLPTESLLKVDIAGKPNSKIWLLRRGFRREGGGRRGGRGGDREIPSFVIGCEKFEVTLVVYVEVRRVIMGKTNKVMQFVRMNNETVAQFI